MEFNKIAVVGGGTMGNGIAHVFALKGFHVNLIEMSEELVRKAIKTIEGNLDRQLKKQLIDEKSKSDALARISPIVGLENTPGEVDLVIEAIYENKDAKISLFNKLQNIIKQESIFASNTSSISITELASASRPDKFIGMHFMNPVPMMKLIEIIRGYSTSNSTYNAIKELSLKIDKVPVEVHDYPGFISNRILMPMINEAIYTLMEGVASAEDIDTVMKLGMNHPMGPLTLADFIGLDVCLAIMEVLYNGFNDSKYRPCPLLKKMVAAKKLGRKTGEGFFKYS
ncbi:MAG: 3-hydroxybutyryl-CoA dehydrogenase [Ignavibacteria bacterium RIFOXYC2_FULL_35_16]|nr:MAG: 3-hydroxybutyryl-CoA dehydrogenase [Ignavibacteria bacterium GWC2_35_8]OGU83730.1 MAG: 3-hydroxybutyryl-CoA dehydrogenase [Ignavibacteria bacterium RBG_16_35_7]OGV01771.1 MAG: 3-hydroxybutyryl-CoA dehydrogenase [Ignavibacteria bacterium RIFOXYC2_FULL_35_16]